MPFRLDPRENPAKQLRRIARRQWRAAERALREPDGEHAARVRIKRLRALLRLGRDGLRGWRALDKFLGVQARELGVRRDLQAQAALLARLRVRAPTELAGALRAGEERLESRLRHGADAARRTRERVTARLRARAADLDDCFLLPIDRAALDRRLASALRRARRVARAAAEQPSEARLHRLRRRVKRAAAMLRLLGRRAHGAPGPAELEALGRRLGEDHDLALLRARLARRAGGGAAELRAWLEQRHRRRRSAALGAIRAAFGLHGVP